VTLSYDIFVFRFYEAAVREIRQFAQKQTVGVRAAKQTSDIFLRYSERVSRLLL
jgi:hypothetical protein